MKTTAKGKNNNMLFNLECRLNVLIEKYCFRSNFFKDHIKKKYGKLSSQLDAACNLLLPSSVPLPGLLPPLLLYINDSSSCCSLAISLPFTLLFTLPPFH